MTESEASSLGPNPAEPEASTAVLKTPTVSLSERWKARREASADRRVQNEKEKEQQRFADSVIDNLTISKRTTADLKDTRAELEHKLGIDPDDPKARVEYATTLFDLGEREEALRAVRDSIDDIPENEELHRLAGILLVAEALDHENSYTAAQRDGFFEEAEEHFAEAIAINPMNPDANLFLIADYYKIRNKIDTLNTLVMKGSKPRLVKMYRTRMGARASFHAAVNREGDVAPENSTQQLTRLAYAVAFQERTGISSEKFKAQKMFAPSDGADDDTAPIPVIPD